MCVDLCWRESYVRNTRRSSTYCLPGSYLDPRWCQTVNPTLRLVSIIALVPPRFKIFFYRSFCVITIALHKSLDGVLKPQFTQTIVVIKLTQNMLNGKVASCMTFVCLGVLLIHVKDGNRTWLIYNIENLENCSNVLFTKTSDTDKRTRLLFEEHRNPGTRWSNRGFRSIG